MALLTEDQKKSWGQVINVFGFLLTIAVCIALACKFVLSGYPPLIAWLEPFAETIIVIGAGVAGVVIYDKNKLVK